LDRYTEAIECYDKAIERDPNDALARDNKRYALTKLPKSRYVNIYDKYKEPKNKTKWKELLKTISGNRKHWLLL
jgi:tetratricopeptide (TPR) repeat protein